MATPAQEPSPCSAPLYPPRAGSDGPASDQGPSSMGFVLKEPSPAWGAPGTCPCGLPTAQRCTLECRVGAGPGPGCQASWDWGIGSHPAEQRGQQPDTDTESVSPNSSGSHSSAWGDAEGMAPQSDWRGPSSACTHSSQQGQRALRSTMEEVSQSYNRPRQGSYEAEQSGSAQNQTSWRDGA